MTDLITLLATATNERLWRFHDMAKTYVNDMDRRKQTVVYMLEERHLPAVIEAAVSSAVTLQRVHDPGREEWYETLHRGPMEGWASKPRASTPPYRP